MRKLLPVAAALFVLVPAGSAVAAPSPFRGVVVGARQNTLLVASPSGAVRAIVGHARVGMRVSLNGGRLTVLGRAHRALIRGVVVRRHGALTFLSASHHMLLIRSATRSLAAARNDQPAPGSVVQAVVGIDDQGELDEQNEEVVGQEQEAEVQAVVTAVAAGSVTLSVNGQPLVIPLPAGLVLPASIIGTQVALKVHFGGGTATVSPGASTDDDDQGEDDDDAVAGATAQTTTAVTQARHGGDSGRHGDGGGDD